jgi:hypothetical protein
MFIVVIVVVYFVIDSVRKLLDTPSYSDVLGYQRSGRPYSLHLQVLHPDDGGSVVLLNVGILPHHTTRRHNPDDHRRENVKYRIRAYISLAK